MRSVFNHMMRKKIDSYVRSTLKPYEIDLYTKCGNFHVFWSKIEGEATILKCSFGSNSNERCSDVDSKKLATIGKKLSDSHDKNTQSIISKSLTAVMKQVDVARIAKDMWQREV